MAVVRVEAGSEAVVLLLLRGAVLALEGGALGMLAPGGELRFGRLGVLGGCLLEDIVRLGGWVLHDGFWCAGWMRWRSVEQG